MAPTFDEHGYPACSWLDELEAWHHVGPLP